MKITPLISLLRSCPSASRPIVHVAAAFFASTGLAPIMIAGVGLTIEPAAAVEQQANPPRSVGAAAQEGCGCTSEYKTETTPPTPEVIALFKAAEALDEKAFNELLAKTPDVGRYLVDDHTLLTRLLRPRAPEASAERTEPEVYWEMSEAKRAQLFAAHRATLPVRTRMLAAALKRGAKPNDVTYTDRLPGLHLALLFGSPAMVDLLLSSGADANQAAGRFERHPPIESMLRSEYVVRLSNLPDLVTRGERSAMLLSLIKAGAKRPFSDLDGAAGTQAGSKKPSAAGKNTPQRRSVAADQLLWAPLVEMTEGSDVLTAFLRMGTKPAASAGKENLLARAALAGNTTAVEWLQQRLPRYEKNDIDPAETQAPFTIPGPKRPGPPLEPHSKRSGWPSSSCLSMAKQISARSSAPTFPNTIWLAFNPDTKHRRAVRSCPAPWRSAIWRLSTGWFRQVRCAAPRRLSPNGKPNKRTGSMPTTMHPICLAMHWSMPWHCIARISCNGCWRRAPPC